MGRPCVVKTRTTDKASNNHLPLLLTMEQTKKAGLETGVSSHMVLHNKIRVRKEENMIRKAAKCSKGVMH